MPARTQQHAAYRPLSGNAAPPRPRVVVLSVSFFMASSIALILANKAVLLDTNIPITFLFIQLVVSVALLHVGHALSWFSIPKWDATTARKTVLLAGVNVVGLIANTYTLHLGDASFYQIARGLVLPLTVGMSWFLLTPPSAPVLLTCVVITAGYALGTTLDPHGTAHIPFTAILFGVFSSVTTAAHVIVIKTTQAALASTDTITLVYYNNVLSAAAFPVFMLLSGELSTCWAYFTSDAKGQEATGAVDGSNGPWKFAVGCFITGVLGFLLNIASFFQIKITSPVTHAVSAAARGVVQTALAVWVFNEALTSTRAWSITIITAGSCLYTIAKHRESKGVEKDVDAEDAVGFAERGVPLRDKDTV
ncbi:hypothetical protein HDU87_002668 [Geranomyces variabilis]|uniref:Sugar phosphate transporter domain-containing protein n=1 Tax=Geranomyces variabilis TaxID=109894 RepID=A0AAD5TRK5_9FUNG|nr:hypothetical protein HDU87_002668 [Geranomyces variabilis]